MARVLVGLSNLQGHPRNYAKRFDMVELHPVDASVPRGALLRAWRKSVPPGFVFSVVLPKAVGALTPGAELDRALEVSLEVASAVEARCILLSTSADVRPTALNRRRLVALAERLPREGVVLAWEARGIWERAELLEAGRAAGLLPVFDAAQDDLAPGPIAYTRLRALGKTTSLSASTVEAIAGRLRGRREAFVVVEAAADAARVRTGLKAALGRKAPSGQGAVVRPSVAVPLVAEDEEQ